jgi:hypothetical protein
LDQEAAAVIARVRRTCMVGPSQPGEISDLLNASTRMVRRTSDEKIHKQ